MSDLNVQLREYGQQLDELTPPLGQLISDIEPIRTPVRQTGLRRRGSLAFAGAFLVVVAAVVAATGVLRGGRTDPEISTSVAPWQHSVSSRGIEIRDVRLTGFGLVAAAGRDGIWISPDGSTWRQAVAWPRQPTPADDRPGVTVPDDVGSWANVVAEYDGAVYVFGSFSQRVSVAETTAGSVVWRSDDGGTWEEIALPDQLRLGIVAKDAVVIGDALYVYGREPFTTGIYRTFNGTDWERVVPEGLSRTVLRAVEVYGDEVVAIGEKPGDRGVIFVSGDGIKWEETGPWTVTGAGGRSVPVGISGWSLVDLFATPGDLVAVGFTEHFYSRDHEPSVVVAVTTDGRTFQVLDEQPELFRVPDNREHPCWPIKAPRGVAVDDRIVIFGVSYADESEIPQFHQWTRSADFGEESEPPGESGQLETPPIFEWLGPGADGSRTAGEGC